MMLVEVQNILTSMVHNFYDFINRAHPIIF